jgi:hypothetical protein
VPVPAAADDERLFRHDQLCPLLAVTSLQV